MPMLKRAIEPSDISQSQVDTEIKNELECVANNTLSCIIQQLSSLSKHSEDLFGELYAETYTIATRTSNLSKRIEKLKHKIVQLNPTVEEVLLQEINLKKPFKSLIQRDQQIMVCSTRPYCVNEAYVLCEAPPNLSELDVFREDGKSSLKFYTDPNYFVELWYSEMKAAQHQQKKPKHKQGQVHKNKPKALRTPKNKIEEFKNFRHGPEFVENFRKQNSYTDGSLPNGVNMTVYHSTEFRSRADQQYNELASGFLDNSTISEVRNQVINEEKKHISAKSNSLIHISSSRPMCPPPAPPKTKHPFDQLEINKQSSSPVHFSNARAIHSCSDELDAVRMSPSSNFHIQEESFCSDNSLPPPPPSPHRAQSYSPAEYQHQLPSPPNVSQMSGDDSLGPLPPPPPLPDSLINDMFIPQSVNESKIRLSVEPDSEQTLNTNHLVLSQLDQESLASNSSSAMCSISVQDAMKGGHMMDKGPLIRDTRSDLLAAIREGIQLRKVEEHRLKSEQNKKSGTLDVQSIMEAAFEMRRKALEENESENEEEDETNWSD